MKYVVIGGVAVGLIALYYYAWKEGDVEGARVAVKEAITARETITEENLRRASYDRTYTDWALSQINQNRTAMGMQPLVNPFDISPGGPVRS